MIPNEKRLFEVAVKHPGCSGLGDLLVEAREDHDRSDIIYVLPKKAMHLAPLFYGVLPVMVDMREKRAIGKGMETPARIYLAKEEIEWAANLLKDYKNPLAVGVNCNPYWAYLREVNDARWEKVFSELRKDFTLLQFGLSNQFTPVEGAIKFLDMPIRQVAACYSIIRRYCGVDTGNVHLMQAVGGRVFVAVPPHCDHHNWYYWHYRNVNATYVIFDDMDKLPGMLRKTL